MMIQLSIGTQGQLRNSQASFSRFNSYQDISYNYFSSAFKLNSGVLGIGVTYIDFGTNEKRDELGFLQGSFSNNAIGANLCYGAKLTDSLSAGIGAKIVNEQLASVNYNAIAFDGGMLYRISHNFSLAYSLQNIGGDVKGYQLPLNLKVGALTKMDINSCPVNVCTDLIFPRTGSPKFATGIETNLLNNYFVRLGVNNKQDTGQTITFGLGARFDNISIDFAYVPTNTLGDTIIFSVGVSRF